MFAPFISCVYDKQIVQHYILYESVKIISLGPAAETKSNLHCQYLPLTSAVCR